MERKTKYFYVIDWFFDSKGNPRVEPPPIAREHRNFSDLDLIIESSVQSIEREGYNPCHIFVGREVWKILIAEKVHQGDLVDHNGVPMSQVPGNLYGMVVVDADLKVSFPKMSSLDEVSTLDNVII